MGQELIDFYAFLLDALGKSVFLDAIYVGAVVSTFYCLSKLRGGGKK